MGSKQGEHLSRKLKSGVAVHLIRHPGKDKWQIRFFDISWVSAPQVLTTKTWFPKTIGLGERDFDSPDSACEFLDKHIRVSKVAPAPAGTIAP